MAFERYPPVPATGNGAIRPMDEWKEATAPVTARARFFQSHQYLIPLLLLLLTLCTTTLVGARLARNFADNRPAFDLDRDLPAYLDLIVNPAGLLAGLPFSLTLLGILLSHELGHYLACRYYGVDATLPYFLPAPTFIGTFGAFIRIRSPIYSKRILFDIGVAGPIAGFVVLVPAMAIGIAFSKVLPSMGLRGDLIFGVPLIQRILEALIFPGTAPGDVYLHPIARAAWVGVFATALNLLPIGQLDGGHILYSLAGGWHKVLSRLFIFALVPLGAFFWYGWWFWAVLLFFFSMRHPAIYDEAPLSPGRLKLAAISLVLFVLTFSVAPIRASAGF